MMVGTLAVLFQGLQTGAQDRALTITVSGQRELLPRLKATPPEAGLGECEVPRFCDGC